MRLVRTVIGVLSQNYGTHFGVRGVFQCVENIVHTGIDGLGAVFGQQKLPQILIVGFGKFAVQDGVPVVAEVYHCLSVLSERLCRRRNRIFLLI